MSSEKKSDISFVPEETLIDVKKVKAWLERTV